MRIYSTQKKSGTQSPAQLAVLLPDKPPNEIIDLLQSLKIGGIWRLGMTSAATEEIRELHPTFSALARSE